MRDANLGDGANGQLSEAEVERAFRAFKAGVARRGYIDKGPAVDGLRAALAAIVREHTERAWDEAIDHVWKLSDPVSTIDHAEDPPVCTVFDMRQAKRENPYRAARQERDPR